MFKMVLGILRIFRGAVGMCRSVQGTDRLLGWYVTGRGMRCCVALLHVVLESTRGKAGVGFFEVVYLRIAGLWSRMLTAARLLGAC